MAHWSKRAAAVVVGMVVSSLAASAAGAETGAGGAGGSAGVPPLKAGKTMPAKAPVDLGVGPQLFVDEYLIAESSGVAKVTQHPKRFLDGPVLGWEQHTTQPYVTVLRDAKSGKFRMWYNAYSGKECAVAYAESDDGVKWRTPELGIMGADNRLFLIGRSAEHGSYGVSVIDEGENAKDASKRYKMMWWSGTTEPAGVAVAWSADGLRWTQYEKNPVLPYYPSDHPKSAYGIGDIVDLFYDPIRGRYATLLKVHGVKADGWAPGPRAGNAYRRLVGQSVSDDFVNWKDPWRVMVPEARDEGKLEFYASGGTIARGGVLISFPRMLHDDYSPEPGGEATGIGYAVLATSRDGETWERHDDVFFDRNPEPGAWDRAMTWIGCTLPVGDELYIYYGGYKRGHKVEPTKERQIGLAKLPLDRFVAREAKGGGSPGRILTVPLTFEGKRGAKLVVNAAVTGRLRVQVKDAGGAVVKGFSFDECKPVTGDGVALPVAWGKGLEELPKTIRLEFEIADGQLFGFDMKS